MGELTERLINALELEPLSENAYIGAPIDLGIPRVFGGHVLAQALAAACNTVDLAQSVHSYHAYFLRPGDALSPISYHVTYLRDGRKFCTRRVDAKQNGDIIFTSNISFHGAEQSEYHQNPMPNVPGPDDLLSNAEFLKNYPDSYLKKARLRFDSKIPFEMRFLHPEHLVELDNREAQQCVWFRLKGEIASEFQAKPTLHHMLLAYVSDFNLAGVCGLPHAISGFSGNWQFSSLDHALWFHRPTNMNEWHLYVMDSPILNDARGLNRGSIYYNGHLVASTMQESLLRELG